MKTKLYLVLDADIDQSNKDITAIRKQIARWQELFAPGDDVYSLKGYEDLYTQGENALLVYDNFAEEDTMWRGFEVYRAVWEKQINSNFPGFIMFRIEVDQIEVSGNLAWSGMTWWGSVVQNGQKRITAQHATHIWHKVNGRWAIVHEHLTSGVKENRHPSVRPETADISENAFIHFRESPRAIKT